MWPHIIALPENLPGGERLTASSSRYAAKHLQFRASLVTYARTTLARYYTEGAPILAPTSVHYPEDLRARRRWNQYFWGDAILVGEGSSDNTTIYPRDEETVEMLFSFIFVFVDLFPPQAW